MVLTLGMVLGLLMAHAALLGMIPPLPFDALAELPAWLRRRLRL